MKNLLIVLFLFLFSTLAYSETIKLKTGATFQGEIVELTDDHVVIDRGKIGTFRFAFDQIDDESLSVLKTLPHVTRQKENPSPTQPIETATQENNQKESSTGSDDSAKKADEYVKIGDEQFHLHNFKEAFQNYQKAIEINPQLDYANQMLANCSANFEQYNDAVSYAKKALEINPQNAQVHADLGYYYRALKQYQDSIEEFKIGIHGLSEPYRLYMAYKGLGDSYAFMRNPENALEAYKKAADLQPNDVKLVFNIAGGLAASQKYQESLSYIEQALKIEPENPKFWTAKGGVLTYLKRFDKAKESYQKALDIFQKNGNIEEVNQSKQALMAVSQIQQGAK